MNTNNNIKTRFGPDGTHFFDRKTGLNILFDDTIPASSQWTNSPRQVSIALTNLCNLKCTHCYAPKTNSFLNKESVKLWMKELDKSGCFGIGFGGGEPTLHPDFIELCDYGHNETSLAITFTTHGHTLTEKLIEKIKHNIDFIRVSMDGVGETYESIRGCSFDRFIEKLPLLKEHIPFGINYVVNARTVNELDSAINIAESYGASEFLLLPEAAVGLGTQIDKVTINKLQSWVADYKGNVRLSISSGSKDAVAYLKALESESEHLAYAHIDASGYLKKTSFEQNGYKISSKGVMATFNNLYHIEGKII